MLLAQVGLTVPGGGEIPAGVTTPTWSPSRSLCQGRPGGWLAVFPVGVGEYAELMAGADHVGVAVRQTHSDANQRKLNRRLFVPDEEFRSNRFQRA